MSLEKIKNYFVNISEDKFTKVKTIDCKFEIELSKVHRLGTDGLKPSLRLHIDRRQLNELDSIFFTIYFKINDGGFPGMEDMKLYLLLDDSKNIELSDVSECTHDAITTEDLGGDPYNVYAEQAQLKVSESDYISIAKANKIEFSLRCDKGKAEGTLNNDQLIILKGFYNNAFDENFELEILDNAIAQNRVTNPPSGRSSCYIATMAYGSSEHRNVLILREFRDNILLKSYLGTKFTEAYYKISPLLVKKLHKHKTTNQLIRFFLDFVIKLIK